MQYQDDILAALDAQETKKQEEENLTSQINLSVKNNDILEIESHIYNQSDISLTEIYEIWTERVDTLNWENETHTPQKKKNSFLKNIIFFLKYISTSAVIFAVLLLVSNYSAYWNITKSVIFAGELEETKKSLIESVAAGSIIEEAREKEHVDTFRNLTVSWTLDESQINRQH